MRNRWTAQRDAAYAQLATPHNTSAFSAKDRLTIAISLFALIVSFSGFFLSNVYENIEISLNLNSEVMSIQIANDKKTITVDATVSVINSGNRPILIHNVGYTLYVLDRDIDDQSDCESARDFTLLLNLSGDGHDHAVKAGDADVRTLRFSEDHTLWYDLFVKDTKSSAIVNVCSFLTFDYTTTKNYGKEIIPISYTSFIIHEGKSLLPYKSMNWTDVPSYTLKQRWPL